LYSFQKIDDVPLPDARDLAWVVADDTACPAAAAAACVAFGLDRRCSKGEV